MFPRNPLHGRNRRAIRATAEQGVTIRQATAADRAAVGQLAALDGKQVPQGELVLAEVGRDVVAAVPVSGGPAVADPFRPTAHLLPLLELRALHLRGAYGSEPAAPARRAAWAPRLAR